MLYGFLTTLKVNQEIKILFYDFHNVSIKNNNKNIIIIKILCFKNERNNWCYTDF